MRQGEAEEDSTSQLVRPSEKERARERESERETARETERQRDRETERDRERWWRYLRFLVRWVCRGGDTLGLEFVASRLPRRALECARVHHHRGTGACTRSATLEATREGRSDRDKQEGRQAGRQAGRLAGRQAGRQRSREADWAGTHDRPALPPLPRGPRRTRSRLRRHRCSPHRT